MTYNPFGKALALALVIAVFLYLLNLKGCNNTYKQYGG